MGTMGTLPLRIRHISFQSLHEKCLYSEIFWSTFSSILTKSGDLQSKSPYSVRMRENTDQQNSEYGQFLTL